MLLLLLLLMLSGCTAGVVLGAQHPQPLASGTIPRSLLAILCLHYPPSGALTLLDA